VCRAFQIAVGETCKSARGGSCKGQDGTASCSSWFPVPSVRMVSTPNSYYRISSADRVPLRIDLLLDSSDEISAFAARIIEDIKASNFARIELLVVKQANAGRQAPATRPDSRSLRLLRRISDPKLTSARWSSFALLFGIAHRKLANSSRRSNFHRHLQKPRCRPSLSQSKPPDQARADSVTASLSNKIMELSRERYSERHMKTIGPEHWKGLSDIHYNRAGKVELIDGRSPAPLRRVLAAGGES
jgi:hypothetical protein